MKTLSENALWVWLLLSDGDFVAGAEDGLMARFVESGGDESWSLAELESAVDELRAAAIFTGDGPVTSSAFEAGESWWADGMLVEVSVRVFSPEEILQRGLIDFGDGITPVLSRTGRHIAKSGLALYWCETSDHDEDWFVIAPNANLARSFFEEAEGYDLFDSVVTWVAEIATASDSTPRWPTDEEITSCGGEFVPYFPSSDLAIREAAGVVSKAVKFGSRVFVAGDVVANNTEPGDELIH